MGCVTVLAGGTCFAQPPSMIDPIFKGDTYLLAQKLLDATAMRQEAIASNIANAETPGYHRLDVNPDFESQLKARMSSGDPTASMSQVKPQLSEDLTARSIRPDGNTVEIEHELLVMNQNAVQHDYLAEVVSNNLRQLRMAITGKSIS
jgi:flagellar basal-body rod protein FlgB